MSIFYLILIKASPVVRRKNRGREGIRTACDIEITGTLCVFINIEHNTVFHKKSNHSRGVQLFLIFSRKTGL